MGHSGLRTGVMSRARQTIAIALAAVMLTAVLAPLGTVAAEEGAELSIDVDQAEDGSATVIVIQNNTGVDTATVHVDTIDENATYAGTGEYETDENGTVGLPAPNESVNVEVSAETDNQTETTTVMLAASDDPFGQVVSTFVQKLQNDRDGALGPFVAQFVLSNNPAADKIPDHAGPPDHVTDDDEGPPGHDKDRGPPEDDDRGPPDDRGPSDDGDDGDGEDDEDDGDGPPSDRGPP